MERHHTIIVDLSVAMHQIHDVFAKSESEGNKEHWMSILKAQLSWMQSTKWLGKLETDPERTQIIAVTDSKPYWRSEYLLNPEVYERIIVTKRGKEVSRGKPVHYKAGRSLPSYQFTKVKEKTKLVYAERGWKMLAAPGYEADDLAAAIVMINRRLPIDKQHDITMLTVDSDWTGLVDERTRWFCMYGWKPRLRHDMEVINKWAKRRLKTTLTVPRDIWDIKAAQGDKSDALPAGSPLEVIDLLQPPEEHRLWENPGMRGVIKKLLLEPGVLPDCSPGRAEEYLRRMGIPKFISTYDPYDFSNIFS